MSAQFKVKNAAGMWLRSAPVVNEETKRFLLPKGQLVTRLGNSENPDWWRVESNVEGADVQGFSNKTLLIPVEEAGAGGLNGLMARTMAALDRVAPDAHENYRTAIAQGAPLFEQHGVTTPERMAHFLAQAMQETGSFTVLREDMRYRAPRIREIFGVGNHSAKVTHAESLVLAHKPRELAERVYGLGNPSKAEELGNTEPGDGFAFRGNGVFQTTGRGSHRRMGIACGLEFETQPELLTTAEHALKPALQEWTHGNLNVAADSNQILRITKFINGGVNGLAERKIFFAKLLPLLREDG